MEPEVAYPPNSVFRRLILVFFSIVACKIIVEKREKKRKIVAHGFGSVGVTFWGYFLIEWVVGGGKIIYSDKLYFAQKCGSKATHP